MANKTVITVTHGNESFQTVQDLLARPATKPRDNTVRVSRYFEGVSVGNRSASYTVQCNTGDATTATGTITFSGVSTAADTILINGTTLTAVASGATNNQWNVKGTAALQAAEVVRAINASTTAIVSGAVIASAGGAVVTITAASSGPLGNMATIAKGTDAGSVMTVSGAKLTGGANPTTSSAVNNYRCGV